MQPVAILAFLLLCHSAQGQQEELYFGTVESNHTIEQAPFVSKSSSTNSPLIYARYGRTPVDLSDIRRTAQTIRMT